MVGLVNLRVSVCTEGASQSIASLKNALETVSGLSDLVIEAGFGPLIFGDDRSGLFRCEAIDLSASGAGDLHSLRVMPDERYIELIAAVTIDGGPYVSGFVHGWPILSVGSSIPTVAEAGSAASAPGGGLRS